MPSTRTVSAKALPEKTTKELDIYAAEFAKLVDRHTPSRHDGPSDWLRRLPDEAFEYFAQGISTFGDAARTPIERRGRLYLIHTALLFLWMSWGKDAARERFEEDADEATRRAASLVTIEHYRRAGVLATYDANDWFSRPVGAWTVSLISGAVDVERVADDSLRAALRVQTTVSCSVNSFGALRAAAAVPSRDSLSL
jgi:hypothetical protein